MKVRVNVSDPSIFNPTKINIFLKKLNKQYWVDYIYSALVLKRLIWYATVLLPLSTLSDRVNIYVYRVLVYVNDL